MLHKWNAGWRRHDGIIQVPKRMTGDLDEVRGVLAALANCGTSWLQPISTNAVTAALKRRNRSIDSGPSLDRLGKVGDVQRLRFGLWLPCSTTLVRCAGLLVVVSGLPTPRLATELGEKPRTLGDSRAVAGSSIAESDIRLRDFGTWCRAPTSSLRWSETLIAKARYLQGTLTEGMEWHDHWSAGRRARWSELHPDVDLERGPALARLKSRDGAVEYFLLRRYDGALQLAEVPKAEGEHQRLRYALLAVGGNPMRFRIARREDGFMEVSLPRNLPGPEAMVMAAMARRLTNPDDWEQAFSLPESAWPQVEHMLMGLGLARSDAA